jgi:hypothetical protein
MDFATVCAMLGKTKRQVLRLMNNPQFPTPTGNDDLCNITWDGAAISAFGTLLLGAEVNGWILTDDMLASADWATLAATVPGPSYLATVDPLDPLE